jgi:ECF transporter S component (folate family)
MADRILTTKDLLRELNNYSYRQLHIHHTWKPTHRDFNGENHLKLQQSMRNYHINTNGWTDIGHHLALMPDGKWVTGRPFNATPASIKGWNDKALAVEMVGNFDIPGTGAYNTSGYDKLEGAQKESILQLIKYFGPVPIYISSLLLGPFYGSITGGVADALGYLVKPLGPYSPGFTINGILTGLMPALLARFYREKESWWRIFLIIAPVEIVTSLLLTPLWLSMLTGKAFIVFVPSNLISKVFLIPIYVTLIKIILKLSRQTIPALK